MTCCSTVDLAIAPIVPQIWGKDVILDISWTSGSSMAAVCHNDIDDSGAVCGDFVFNEAADGFAGTGTITIPVTEYVTIYEHSRYIYFYNNVTSMNASLTFEVQYEILVSSSLCPGLSATYLCIVSVMLMGLYYRTC